MSYNNQIVVWGGGSTFTNGSWAPTWATPTTPPFYYDDTNNQFYAYNWTAWEAETDRTVWSGTPTWATATNPPFYWDDVANKLYLWNGTAWETQSSWASGGAATWGTNYNIDITSYALTNVSWQNWRSLVFWQTWKYYVYWKVLSDWWTIWWYTIDIYRNVSGTLTLLDTLRLNEHPANGSVNDSDWLSNVIDVTSWDTLHIVAWWIGTLKELQIVFGPQRPDPVIDYLTNFESNTYVTWAWVAPIQRPTWSNTIEQPFNPTISYDPTTARFATLWPAAEELTITTTWNYDITIICYWVCDFPWIWWFPAGNKYDLYVNWAMVQSVWVWSNTWFFCIADSTVTFPSVSLNSWDVIYVRKTQWTVWFSWTFNNQLYIYKN